MSNQRETKLPNIYRNPLIVQQIVADMSEVIEDWEKALTERSGSSHRSLKAKIQRNKAFLNELDRNAEARIGGQLDG